MAACWQAFCPYPTISSQSSRWTIWSQACLRSKPLVPAPQRERIILILSNKETKIGAGSRLAIKHLHRQDWLKAACHFQPPSTVRQMHLNQTSHEIKPLVLFSTGCSRCTLSLLGEGRTTLFQRAKSHPTSTQTEHHSQAFEWAHRISLSNFKLKACLDLCFSCSTSYFSRFPQKAFGLFLNHAWLWISRKEILFNRVGENELE